MTTVCFHHLVDRIQEVLSSAREEVQIAVCWFTHTSLFETVLDRLRNGVAVDLLIEYDRYNIRPGGLDFELLLRAGGRMFVRGEPGLMHHKFALIDGRTVLSGSFNWTYNTNAENLLISDDPMVVTGFRHEFLRLRRLARPVTKICPEQAKPFSPDLFLENASFDLEHLRRQVVRGARIWTVRLDRFEGGADKFFQASRLCFDPERRLEKFWRTAVFWDEALFDRFWKAQRPWADTAPGRSLRCLMRRIRPGDFLLASLPPNRLMGLAEVKSEPKPAAGPGCSSFLEIQWLKDVRGQPVQLPEKLAPWAVARYRASALHLLQKIFDQSTL